MLTRISLAAALCLTAAHAGDFDNWPAGKSPREIGKRVAERFVTSAHVHANEIVYQEDCAWYGALTLARLTGDKDLTRRLVARFDPLLTPEGSKLISQQRHVDFSVFGIVPLELAIEGKGSKYLNLGVPFAERQWQDPQPDGLSGETRYWVDDMYMITALQVQAFRATRNPQYAELAVREMVSYLEMQQPSGLFYHALDVPFFWGRGNGWAAAGMTELLRSLPKEHPKHAAVLAAYRKMMASLLQYQGSDGMWKQLLDHPEAWPETSCTGMFTFAMITGVKNGWLDAKTYGPAARKAWLALTGYLNADADLTDVCEGTGKKNDLQYYLDRKRNTGDMHGQAPVLWCASALLRK